MDIKNPTDNWITAGYAIFYWTMNRMYHLARYNLGLSPLINGTGFMVRFDVIKPEGWVTKTLTEDIEFSLKRIINHQNSLRFYFLLLQLPMALYIPLYIEYVPSPIKIMPNIRNFIFKIVFKVFNLIV